MRFLIFVVALSPIAILACSSSDEEFPNVETVQIMRAINFIQNGETPDQVEPRGLAPLLMGEQDCLIPATSDSYLEGTCEWKTSQSSDGGWVASYVETWKCEDYNALAGTTEFCRGETGTHKWDYLIAPDGTTTLFIQTGDPAPEGLGAGAPGQ